MIQTISTLRVNALTAPPARPAPAPANPTRSDATPFRDATEAWFWTMRALVARRDVGRRPGGGDGVRRPCDPDDVIKALDTLYRRRRVDIIHARVLRIWGERQKAPDPIRDRADWANWREAMTRLEWPLRVRGIVGARAACGDA